ncbi:MULTISPECIES: hypothetical protein [Streptomyces]|uniref:Uncharacterized protein n=1 Tax=Streptomyces demainii TaxID=588122 RepID=A0ABT9KWK3_9ACTN|nr:MULTISPECIES: hypothetical protein [Streptomyces]MDP9612818.1 hypothetical protein [Streptomyces demainii]
MPHSTPAQGPRFLTHPRALIIDTVAATEPGLPPQVIEAAVDHVAGTRAKLRRLAQALDTAPHLLTSGTPEGPRLIELLIRALQPQGTTHLVLPRCAGCSQQHALTRVDGNRRLCGNCGDKARGDALRLPCAVCGKNLLVASRDNNGQPRCQRHRPQETDDVALICTLLRKLDTGLDDQTLAEIVSEAAPRPFQRRQITAELISRPDLLTGQGAYGSPRVLALIDALVAHGARTILPPACPFCHRTTALKFRRDNARCCRRCYDEARLQPCSSCGQQQPVATRTPGGQPLCTTCMRSDPLNHEPCTGCGRLTIAVHHDDSQQHEADLADALDQLMRRVHSGHATTAEQALLARATMLPIPAARHPHLGTGPTTSAPAQHDELAQHDEDDSIDELDDLPDDDTHPAAATGYGLYDAYEEADKW